MTNRSPQRLSNPQLVSTYRVMFKRMTINKLTGTKATRDESYFVALTAELAKRQITINHPELTQ